MLLAYLCLKEISKFVFNAVAQVIFPLVDLLYSKCYFFNFENDIDKALRSS